MAQIQDVAAYILELTGVISTMKLQKLAFYSHAYHLINYKEPLFDDSIEAWPNGPVIRSLFCCHARMFLIDKRNFPAANPNQNLTKKQKNSIECAVAKLGNLSGNELSNMTHNEKPWKDQRVGLESSQASNREITNRAIRDFYSNKVPFNPLFS